MSLGWVALPGLLTPGEIAGVNADAARMRLEPQPTDKPNAGTVHLRQLDLRSATVADIVERPRLLEAVAAMTASPDPAVDGVGATDGDAAPFRLRLERTQTEYRCPQPGFGGQKLHADDVPKLDTGPGSGATAIIALTDFVAGNGATRVVPGSHRRPDLQRESGKLASLQGEVLLTGAAGTGFVFSAHLLHSGTKNTSGYDRPALQVVWRVASPV